MLCCLQLVTPWTFLTRILELVAISSSRGSLWPRDQTHISCVSCITGAFLTAESPGKPIPTLGGWQILLHLLDLAPWGQTARLLSESPGPSKTSVHWGAQEAFVKWRKAQMRKKVHFLHLYFTYPKLAKLLGTPRNNLQIKKAMKLARVLREGNLGKPRVSQFTSF